MRSSPAITGLLLPLLGCNDDEADDEGCSLLLSPSSSSQPNNSRGARRHRHRWATSLSVVIVTRWVPQRRREGERREGIFFLFLFFGFGNPEQSLVIFLFWLCLGCQPWTKHTWAKIIPSVLCPDLATLTKLKSKKNSLLKVGNPDKEIHS